MKVLIINVIIQVLLYLVSDFDPQGAILILFVALLYPLTVLIFLLYRLVTKEKKNVKWLAISVLATFVVSIGYFVFSDFQRIGYINQDSFFRYFSYISELLGIN